MKDAPAQPLGRTLRTMTLFGVVLLVVEFLDEFVFGAREAAWPLMRTDLGLRYVQVGLLLSLPGVVNAAVKPALGILGDVWRRRVLILGGGVAFAVALSLVASSRDYLLLLLGLALLAPASGAFVSLSQATLMDLDPARPEQSMARWTFAGSVGAVAGPLALGAALGLGLGWRGLFVLTVGLTLLVLAVAWTRPFPARRAHGEQPTFRGGVTVALRALRRRDVLRWLALLECSDLMLDILLGYLALYVVDVARATPVEAGLAVAVWMTAGLLGDLLLIPLLERLPGLRYLRASVAAELILFPAFLLAPGLVAKLLLLALVSFCKAGWYPILKGQLYSSMPGQSGTVLAVGAVSGLAGSLLPLAIGLAAQRFGLGATMWLLLLGPIALMLGLPRSGTPPRVRAG